MAGVLARTQEGFVPAVQVSGALKRGARVWIDPQSGVVAREELDTIDREVAALIEHAVQEAKAAPQPGPEDLLTDVYISY